MNLNNIFKIALKGGASDVHIIVGQPPILRINGELSPLPKTEVITRKTAEELILSILTPAEKERFLQERELDISYPFESGERFRVNLHFEKDNMGLVARLVPSVIPTMQELQSPTILYDLARLKQGLVLLTGPTGCGKSTTLASIVEMINNERSVNIITFEDPIEFLFQPKKAIIKQRQLGTDIISFAEGLKHVLRQDPNVVMVGEIRDLETMSTTITLAETGHLVLATLHTPDAAQTIDRIIDSFPPHQQNQVRLQVANTLAGIVAQKLLPGKNGGRVAAREILINTSAVSNLIRENKIAQIGTIIQTNSKIGMTTFEQDIKRLYKEKQVSEEVADAFLNDIKKR